MKKISFTLIVLSFALFSFGQTKLEQWPELNAYHRVLSETFHPSEKGDLRPVKTRSHELFANAKLVASSMIPQEFDNEKVKKAVAKMVRESDKLNALVVRQEQDMTLMKQLNVVHDAFHEVTGLCSKKEESGSR